MFPLSQWIDRQLACFVLHFSRELARQCCLQNGLSKEHIPNGFNDFMGLSSFQYITIGSGPQNSPNIGFIIVGCQNHDSHRQMMVADPSGGFDTVSVGHLDIQHCYIG